MWGGFLAAIFKPRALRFSSKSIPLAHLYNCDLRSCRPTIFDIAASNSSILSLASPNIAFRFFCSWLYWVRSSCNLSPPPPWCKTWSTGVFPSYSMTNKLVTLSFDMGAKWFVELEFVYDKKHTSSLMLQSALNSNNIPTVTQSSARRACQTAKCSGVIPFCNQLKNILSLMDLI